MKSLQELRKKLKKTQAVQPVRTQQVKQQKQAEQITILENISKDVQKIQQSQSFNVESNIESQNEQVKAEQQPCIISSQEVPDQVSAGIWQPQAQTINLQTDLKQQNHEEVMEQILIIESLMKKQRQQQQIQLEKHNLQGQDLQNSIMIEAVQKIVEQNVQGQAQNVQSGNNTVQIVSPVKQSAEKHTFSTQDVPQKSKIQMMRQKIRLKKLLQQQAVSSHSIIQSPIKTNIRAQILQQKQISSQRQKPQHVQLQSVKNYMPKFHQNQSIRQNDERYDQHLQKQNQREEQAAQHDKYNVVDGIWVRAQIPYIKVSYVNGEDDDEQELGLNGRKINKLSEEKNGSEVRQCLKQVQIPNKQDQKLKLPAKSKKYPSSVNIIPKNTLFHRLSSLSQFLMTSKISQRSLILPETLRNQKTHPDQIDLSKIRQFTLEINKLKSLLQQESI